MNIGLKTRKYRVMTLAIFMAMPLLTGCKDKTPEVKNVSYIDLQVTGFSIEKKNDIYLKNLKFAINQNYGNSNGEIHNVKKIEYGVKIDSIKLNIDYSIESVKSLEYKVGVNSDFKAFNPKTDSIFIGDERTITLKMISKIETNSPRLYNIDLRQYTYKSGSIDYKDPTNLDLYSIGEWSKSIVANNEVYIFTRTGSENKKYIVDSDGGFSKQEIKGIPTTKAISNVVYLDENTTYAMTEDGSLYVQKTKDGDFTSVGATKIVALLGYIRTNTNVRLAVIKKDNSGVSRFTTFDNAKFTEGQEVPKEFPLSGFTSINSKELWVGDNIHLIGGRDSDGAYNNKIWYTTNGTDWLKTEQTGLPENINRSSITKYNNEIYQLVSTTDNKIKLFVLSNKGNSWIEQNEGLPSKDFDESVISTKPFVTFAIDKLYYILVGDGGSKSIIYKGELRRLSDK